MNTMHSLAAATLLSAIAFGQPPAAEDPVDLACTRLLRTIDPPDGNTPPRKEQIAAIEGFLAEHAEQRTHDCVLRLRTRLGTLLLHACRFADAEKQFDAILRDARQDQRDFLGRARYGKAQALILLDEPAAARRILEEITTLHDAERYARFAKVMLERLDQAPDVGPWIGQRAPRLPAESLVDLDGRPHQMQWDAARPLLLVFFSPEDDNSIARLRAVTRAWERGGGARQDILAFSLAPAEVTRRKRKEHVLTAPILVCDAEFLHPIALAYHVDRLPTVVVVSAAGMVLGRDLPAAEIERMVAKLVR